MGRQKEELARLEGLYVHAQAIAVQAGAIEECEDHPGTFLNLDDTDAEKNAYAIATNKIKKSSFAGRQGGSQVGFKVGGESVQRY